MTKRFSAKEEAFWRKLVMSEEDHILMGKEWRGGYRWFRSENVVPIEHYRIETKLSPQLKAS
jgi:hypothetical protein